MTTEPVSRRKFVQKAAVAGTAVWVVPTILSISPAAASDLNSRPPRSDPPVDSAPGEPVVDGSGHSDVYESAGGGSGGVLAYTGTNPVPKVVAGVTAAAAGAAVIAKTHRQRSYE